MPITKTWYQTDVVKAIAVIFLSVFGATGVQMQFPARSNPWTGSMQEDYAKSVNEKIEKLEKQQQIDRDNAKTLVEGFIMEMEKYSDEAAEDTRLEILLHLAENYLTKDEIPPDRVDSALARSAQFQDTANLRFQSQDERIQTLSDRITRCCYQLESHLNQQKKMSNPIVKSNP